MIVWNLLVVGLVLISVWSENLIVFPHLFVLLFNHIELLYLFAHQLELLGGYGQHLFFLLTLLLLAWSMLLLLTLFFGWLICLFLLLFLLIDLFLDLLCLPFSFLLNIFSASDFFSHNCLSWDILCACLIRMFGIVFTHTFNPCIILQFISLHS